MNDDDDDDDENDDDDGGNLNSFLYLQPQVELNCN